MARSHRGATGRGRLGFGLAARRLSGHVRAVRCLVAANRDVLGAAGTFGEGLAAERLFWRWAPAGGWIRSLAGHAVLVALECLQCLMRPALLRRLTGRFWAGLHLPAHRAALATDCGAAAAGRLGDSSAALPYPRSYPRLPAANGRIALSAGLDQVAVGMGFDLLRFLLLIQRRPGRKVPRRRGGCRDRTTRRPRRTAAGRAAGPSAWPRPANFSRSS